LLSPLWLQHCKVLITGVRDAVWEGRMFPPLFCPPLLFLSRRVEWLIGVHGWPRQVFLIFPDLPPNSSRMRYSRCCQKLILPVLRELLLESSLLCFPTTDAPSAPFERDFPASTSEPACAPGNVPLSSSPFERPRQVCLVC